MTENQNETLDLDLGQQKQIIRRRNLLPWWIKLFTWIFLLFGAIAPFGLIFGLLDFNFQLGLYGIETFEPISYTGLLLIGVFLFKGIIAFGLWTERDWAILLGQIDAIIGIVICFFVMFVLHFIDDRYGFIMPLRLELILLIPFLIRLRKVKDEWLKISTPNI